MNLVNLSIRLNESTKKTAKVLAWVGASAAITAVCTFILDEPDYVKYYGIVNIILFFIKELRDSAELVNPTSDN